MTDYLERARVARTLKARLVGVTSSGRGAADAAAGQPRSEATIFTPEFAVAGPSGLPISA